MVNSRSVFTATIIGVPSCRGDLSETGGVMETTVRLNLEDVNRQLVRDLAKKHGGVLNMDRDGYIFPDQSSADTFAMAVRSWSGYTIAVTVLGLRHD
jgi:hypothetical protein